MIFPLGAPPYGALPEQIAEGDLDGDLYFVCTFGELKKVLLFYSASRARRLQPDLVFPPPSSGKTVSFRLGRSYREGGFARRSSAGAATIPVLVRSLGASLGARLAQGSAAAHAPKL